jgi:hypothetical protein
LALSALTKEVRELRHEKKKTSRQHSLSPDPPAARYANKIRKNLEPMNNMYKKAFRVSKNIHFNGKFVY